METICGLTWEEIQAKQQGKDIGKTLPKTNGMITPSQYEKIEWARLAQAAYAADLNDVGHEYSTAASMVKGQSISLASFDRLQNFYRSWLIGGFKKYFIVRLMDGNYIGNMIDGQRTHSFVRTDKANACRFNERHYAENAAASYNITGHTIEETV